MIFMGTQNCVTLCRVCGDRASGRHYGVLTCDGCRGFFKRSVRRNMGYSCKYQGVCPVDMKRRNQCQACRFQRCLAVGMNRHAVQHERLPRKQKCHSTNFRPKEPAKIFPAPAEVSNRTQGLNKPRTTSINLPDPLVLPTHTLKIELPKENRPPVLQQQQQQQQQLKKSGYSIDSLLEVANKERTKCQEPPPLTPPMTPPRSSSALSAYQERIQESLHRILQGIFVWAHNVPFFNELPSTDKTKLLEEAWAELLVLGLVESNYSSDVLSVYLREFVVILKTKEALQKIERLEMVIQKLKSLVLDQNEMAYLKAIALFKPDLQSLVMRQHIEDLQDQAQTMLGEYTRAYHPGNNTRFGKLILSLPILRSVDPKVLESCLKPPRTFYPFPPPLM